MAAQRAVGRMRLMSAPADIVVYEEDFLTRALVKEWLEHEGYRVRIGNRCRPGGDGRCDLVILSVVLPRQSGAQCTQDIQSAHSGTPMIAISGHFRPGLPAAGSTAQLLRVQQVVAKPLAREELLESVRVILNH
jgi:DNA-binding response OmpR family regulator